MMYCARAQQAPMIAPTIAGGSQVSRSALQVEEIVEGARDQGALAAP